MAAAAEADRAKTEAAAAARNAEAAAATEAAVAEAAAAAAAEGEAALEALRRETRGQQLVRTRRATNPNLNPHPDP